MGHRVSQGLAEVFELSNVTDRAPVEIGVTDREGMFSTEIADDTLSEVSRYG